MVSNQSVNQSINPSKRHLRIAYMWCVERWWRHFVQSLDPVLFMKLFFLLLLFFVVFFHIIHFNCCRMPPVELPLPAWFLWRLGWPAVQRHHVRTHAHHSAREAVVQEWIFCRNRGTRETKFLAQSNLSTGPIIDTFILCINVISLTPSNGGEILQN